MEKKITKKNYFEMIKEICKDREDIVDFCDRELELLARKSARSGNTKKKEENLIIADILLDELKLLNKPVTISELMGASSTVKNYVLENGNPLTNQKIKAIFGMLLEDKKITRTEIKKKAYFSAVKDITEM